MRLGPAEPALASPAPTGLCSVQRAAFSHRAHTVAGVSLAALCCAAGPLLSLLTLTLTQAHSLTRNAWSGEGRWLRRTVADSPLHHLPRQDTKFAQNTRSSARHCTDYGQLLAYDSHHPSWSCNECDGTGTRFTRSSLASQPTYLPTHTHQGVCLDICA